MKSAAHAKERWANYSTTGIRMDHFADPTNNFAFKKLFGTDQNKNLLVNFVNCILPTKHVEIIEYIPTPSPKPSHVMSNKYTVIDLLCYFRDGTKYLIQIQNTKGDISEKEIFDKACHTYINEIEKRGIQFDLTGLISITICDSILFPKKTNYISTHIIHDDATKKQSLQELIFIFIELPKYQSHNGDNLQGIEAWCEIFKSIKYRQSINTTSLIINKAYETLNISNWSAQDLYEYETNDKNTFNNISWEEQSRDDGTVETAKEMLRENEDIEKIMKYTKLSIELLEKLKQEL